MEQHILCRAGVAGCKQGEYSIANATRERGYLSGFYGKWHLGSLSDRGVGSPDCYAKPADQNCQQGYWERNGGCCFGVDGQLDVSNPLHFGFDEFVATPECAASATTNCGCFFYPTPHNDTPCEVGHYRKGGTVPPPYLECMQYYRGNRTDAPPAAAAAGASAALSVEPFHHVTPVDDERFLVDQVEGLIQRAQREDKPFFAAVFFHGAHIPYVATPESRAPYARLGMDENHQDYWGTISQIDAAVGRLRELLVSYGVANSTWVSITADNGPEVSPAGGQGTGNFINPGRTGGLRGRKRDATEGGTREIGIIEYPPAVKANAVHEAYPIITMDVMATILDILGMPSHAGRALDGHSLLKVLAGEEQVRPTAAGIGIHGSFPYGDTNHQLDPKTGKMTVPFRCPVTSASAELGDIPANFSSAGHGMQFSWAEGNDMKIFGCKGYCNGQNCNSTSPGFKNPGWHFMLYNLTADRAETTDLWQSQRGTANAMLGRFLAWQDSIRQSQGAGEIGCDATLS